MVRFKSTGPTLFSTPRKFWSEYREASLNWLALGLLLAAWNAVDHDEASGGAQVAGTQAATQRPQSLHGYSTVSVKAVQRSVAQRI
jgi:hypothetical protein